MSFAANTALKTISMVTNGCSNPCPSFFTATKISRSNPFASIQLKPLKSPYLFSLKRKEPFYRISVVAAYQEDNNTVFLEEREEEEEEGEEKEEEERQQLQGDLNFGSFGFFENGENNVDLSEEAKLYVGNLHYDVDSEQLKHIFFRAGGVSTAQVIKDSRTGQSRGFGFVTMSTVEEAEKAVEIMHRYDVYGRLLVVNKACQKGSRPERAPHAPQSIEPSYRIYAGNLSWTVVDWDLESIFSEYGKVVKAWVFMDKETGKSRGFGFVVMSSESEMNDAIDNLDGQDVKGRPMKVKVAEPRRDSY